MKAMILAAGRGGRLRPLTNTVPKCLIPVKGKPLVHYHLEAMAAAGVKEVVINLFHLADLIQNTLKEGHEYGLHITYSREPELLGTGGGILHALPLLGNAPFMVVSGDLWTDFPLSRLPKNLSAGMHLVMVDNPNFHPMGDFHLSGNKLMESGGPLLTYANIGVYHPDLFQGCSPSSFPLAPLMRKAIHAGQATGEHYKGQWVNVGSPKELALLP